MKHIIRKAFWDYEKEEKWINQMCARGWALTDYSWCRYVFEECREGEFIYRIQMLDDLPADPKSVSYIRFLEETGIEYVTCYMKWVYFRRKTSDGSFDLYSDLESRIKHYKKVFTMWLLLAVAEMLIGGSNIQLSIIIQRNEIPFNLFMGIPLFLLGFVILLFLVLPLHRKIKALQKEMAVRE